MRFVIVAVLVVVVGVVVNEISGVLGAPLLQRLRRRRLAYISSMLVVAIVAGAAAEWVQSDGASSPEPSSEQEVSASSQVGGAQPDDSRLAVCADAESLVSGDGEPVLTSALAFGVAAEAGVANVTCLDTSYKSEVGAGFDHVVKVQFRYAHVGAERESPLSIRVSVQQPADGRALVTGEFATDEGPVTVQAAVGLRSDGFLAFVPNSAVWRRNVVPPPATPHFENQTLGLVPESEPYLLTTLGDEDDEVGTVSVQFRIMVPSIGVEVEGRLSSEVDWLSAVTAPPGTELEVRIRVSNAGNTDLRQVRIRVALPDGTTYVDDSLVLGLNGEDPSFYPDSDLALGGLIAGDLEVGGTATLEFRVVVGGDSEAEAIVTGFANALGGAEFYNSLTIATSS